MGKPAKWVWVRSTLSPRLTVKITVPSPPASSTVHQSRSRWALWHRGVEKQLNQTWVSSYRTNASSAFFSSARGKLREGVLKEAVLKVKKKKKSLQKRAKTFCVTRWPMQELAEGLRETLAQFRASFFPGDGLKPGVRHILRPLTPWFTSPRNYLCASTPRPPPPKDNVTICLFNCLSVTLLQAFSVGVYGFFFHLYLFIYLAWRGWGVVWPQKQGVFVWAGFTWI